MFTDENCVFITDYGTHHKFSKFYFSAYDVTVVNSTRGEAAGFRLSAHHADMAHIRGYPPENCGSVIGAHILYVD